MEISRFYEALFERAPMNFLIHIVLVLLSVLISIVISVPFGIALSREKMKKYSGVVLSFLNIFQTIPAFAFIAIAMPLLGFGYKPTIIVLTLQSLLPITRNTIVGLYQVDKSVKEAAKGMGMNSKQVLLEVEIPLAMPLIISGIKTASVYVVSVAILGGFIGAGGLGVLISSGLSMLRPEYLIVGATLCALIAIVLDKSLGYVEKKYMIKK